MSMPFTHEQTSVPYDRDDYRSYLIHQNAPPIVHHSAGQQFKRLEVLSRRILRALGRGLHRCVLAIQEAKMRRIERELRMHGISCRWADDMTPLGSPSFAKSD